MNTPADKSGEGFSSAYLCELARDAALRGVLFQQHLVDSHLYSKLAKRIEELEARPAPLSHEALNNVAPQVPGNGVTDRADARPAGAAPTPRTDAFYEEWGEISPNFARQLERELNAWQIGAHAEQDRAIRCEEAKIGTAPSSIVATGDVFLCCASGEGQAAFKVCRTEDEVFAFYKDQWGEDQDGGIQSQIDHFHDPDHWSNEGRIYSCDLYCSRFEVWKADASEVSAPSATVTPQFEDKPAAWLIVRHSGTGGQKERHLEVVLSPLTDDTFMDEGDEAWPLHAKRTATDGSRALVPSISGVITRRRRKRL